MIVLIADVFLLFMTQYFKVHKRINRRRIFYCSWRDILKITIVLVAGVYLTKKSVR